MGEVSSFVLPPTPLVIDGITFPAFVTPPDSSKPFFLGGAGVRGLDIGGQFIKFTAIAVYLEESALQILAQKWSSNTADELTGSLEFYRDIINGPFNYLRSSIKLPSYITFSKDDSVPETNNAVIENTALSYTVLETIIGQIPVSPAAKRSLAVRFSEHFKLLSTTISQAKEQMEVPSPVTQPLEAALKLN
ncbi:Chalcone-flavonone isomerase family protein [Rhynchospora pubera]|uniref:Chalcone-flavonone isomerase family protein n=1 Tax=Rhynchospora pubera TaxID=906938 RepID=A0AAV8HRR3_9POAL|nr:Chalcone-flavonone isomerase family protein [Rhynchospora pubera]